MRVLFRLAWRNLCRHKRRSFLTGLMIGVGTLTTVLTLAFSQSIGAKITDSVVRNYTGNIQIHAPVKGEIQVFMATAGDTPFLSASNRILSMARHGRGVLEAVPRLRYQGLLSNGDDSMGISAIGIDPSRERIVSPKIKVLRGSYIHSKNGILLGKEIAKYFDAKIGDEYVLVTTTPDGYTNGIALKLEGIISARGMEAFLDDNLVFVDIAAARGLLYLNHQEVSDIVVSLKKDAEEKTVQSVLQKTYDSAGVRVRVDNWRDVAGMLSGVQMAGVILPQLSLIILLIVVAVGIVNTILMAVMERTREIGTMMALGTKRREILGLFLAETALLSGIASGIACLIGAAVICWLSKAGIPAGVEALEFVFGGKRLYFIFSWPGLFASFAGITVFCVMASYFPARLGTRLNPVDAIRKL